MGRGGGGAPSPRAFLGVLAVQELKKAAGRLAASRAAEGVAQALGRLRELGWCAKVDAPAGGAVSVEWERESLCVLQLCDSEGACRIRRVLVLLELLAGEAPLGLALRFACCEEGELWADRLMVDLVRGRYRPAWWDLGRDWHGGLRRGVLPAPILLQGMVAAGAERVAGRLAELGWLSVTRCETEYACVFELGEWAREVAPVMAQVVSVLAASGGGATGVPRLDAVCRLGLFLHLRCLRAPGSVLARVLLEPGDAGLWAAAVAQRVWRGLLPLWWDRSPSWHAAVRAAVSGLARARQPAQEG